MDFLDLQGHAHQLNYGVPRICNFSSQDFIVVSEADRKPNSEDDFGALQVYFSIFLNIYFSSHIIECCDQLPDSNVVICTLNHMHLSSLSFYAIYVD